MKTITCRTADRISPTLFWIVILGLVGICCIRVNASVTNATISLQSAGGTSCLGGINQTYFAGPSFNASYATNWQGASNCVNISFSKDASGHGATNWLDGAGYADGTVDGSVQGALNTSVSPDGTVTISYSTKLHSSVAAISHNGYWVPSASADSGGGIDCNVVSEGISPTTYQLQYTLIASTITNPPAPPPNPRVVALASADASIIFHTNNIALSKSASGKVIGAFQSVNSLNIFAKATGFGWLQWAASADLDLKVVLTLGPPTGELTFHTLEAGGLQLFSSSDGTDAPLVPAANPAVLATQPVITGGLVADGVTPLLVELNFGASLPTARNYVITLASPVGGTAPIQIATLSGASWQDGNSLAVPTGASNAFFYVKPVKCEDLKLTGSQELTVGLSLRDTSAPGNITATNTLRLRKPPIALIHGYNTDPSTWTPSFRSNLYASRSTNFVISVGYGNEYDNAFNTYGRLDDLSRALDIALKGQVEQPLKANWAFTRYDVVGHSQGGVLARMLCESAPPFAPFTSAPVVSERNHYRGRFRRVITIGSPHNGSVILRYLKGLREKGFPIPKIMDWMGIIQDKFDPFGSQMLEINNPSAVVDPKIPFACITARINGGNGGIPGVCPPCYSLFDMCRFPPGNNQTIGQQLLPTGSDGVVDLESQAGGGGTRVWPIYSPDLAHANGPTLLGKTLFGVPEGQIETEFPFVAGKVIGLLDGLATDFGPFIVPTLRTDAAAVDRLVSDALIVHFIEPTVGPLTTTVFNFTISPPPSLPVLGPATWFAEIFGTNGVSTEGVSWQATGTNNSNVSVSVDDAVPGDVVLYSSYVSLNGVLVAANPVRVVRHSQASALDHIYLSPATAVLSVGDTLTINIWGAWTNGPDTILYVAQGTGSFISSDPSVASIDANGQLRLLALGSTTISASYAGHTASMLVSTINPVVGAMSASVTQNGMVQLTCGSSPGTTNIIETSTDLTTWVPLAMEISTNGIVTFLDTTPKIDPARFYRLRLAGHIPQVLGVTANYASPVPATTNFILAFRFDSTMDTNIAPQVILSNAVPGAVQPVATAEGSWGSVAQLNDTFYTAPITLNSGMSGIIHVFISAAQDTVGGVLPLTKNYTFALNAGGAAVVGWGGNSDGQATAPPGLSNVVSVSSSGYGATGGNYTLALKQDRTVVGWGSDYYGQISGMTELTNVTAIAAGAYSLALLGNGTVVGAGYLWPVGVPPGLSNVTAIAASDRLNLALKSNGAVVAWGDNYYGQANVPAGLTNVVAIAAGSFHALALHGDGAVTAWGGNLGGGGNYTGAATVPVGLSNVVAIAAGNGYSLALTAEHRVIAWGDNSYGQTTVPPNLSNVVAIAASMDVDHLHSLALTSSGEIVPWGYGGAGLVPIPQGLTNVIGIAVGPHTSFAIVVPTK